MTPEQVAMAADADPGELNEPALCPCGRGYVGHADHGRGHRDEPDCGMISCYWHGGARRGGAADLKAQETIRRMLADWAALTDAQRDAALAKAAAAGEHGLVVQVVSVEAPHVATFTAQPDGACAACGRPECDHDRRHDLPGAPAYCLVQPSSVTLLHAVTLPGEPCRVACEPREAQDIAERLAAEGQPCYAVVERWQLL